MNQSNLLIRNVGINYGRMVLTVGIGLYTTRLLFLALTDTDIGIMNVLGASVALIEVIRESLTVSALRYLSVSIGKEDRDLFARTVNTTYGLFFGLAVLLYLVGVCAAPLIDYLQLPDDRRAVAFWVYQFALLGVARTTLAAPIDAVFVSKQAFLAQAILRLPSSFFALGTAAMLFVLPGDRLWNFTVITFVTQTILTVMGVVVCFWMFPESRVNWRLFDSSLMGQLSRFAGWSSVGNLLWTLRMKGSSVVLNLFFGPSLNAAWDAANRVTTYHASLTSGVQNATTPALITAEGAGRHYVARMLVFATGKYTTLPSLFLTIPLLLDTENAMSLWLKNVPPYTVEFVQYLLLTLTIDSMGRGFGTAMVAMNRVGEYVRTFGWYTVLPVPVACIGYWFGMSPVLIVQLIFLLTVTINFFFAQFVGNYMEFNISDWLRHTVWPVLIVAAVGVSAAGMVRLSMEPGIQRLMAVAFANALFSLPAIWWLALDSSERGRFLHAGARFLNRAQSA